MNLASFKNLLAGLMTLALLSLTPWASAQTVALDTVIAVVDDDVIMASELEFRMARVMGQIAASNTQAPPEDVIRKQLMDQLIIESLQLQMAGRYGIEIGDTELDNAIKRLAESQGLATEQLYERAAQDGLPRNQLRQQLRRDMLIEQVQSGSVNRRIRITEQEVSNFLASKQGELFSAPEYQLGHIFLPVPSSATDSDAKQVLKDANLIYEQVQQGKDFRAIAIAKSKGENALQGGDLGWRKITQIPELFADALTNAKLGYVTSPLRSGAGYHILKVWDIKGSTQQIIEQAKVRHILIKPSAILSDDEAQAKLADIRKKIMDGKATFEDMARENSEDIGSMLGGGELGWSLPGQFVPQFEQTMLETSTGDISQPFRSQFGWHILQVEERRQQDMSDEVKRNQARNLLRKRRFEEERINWLQEIRDQAFVEIKSDEPSPHE